MVGAYTFTIKNNKLLCIVDYYSKFPVMKKENALSVDNLIREAKIVFTEFGLSKRIVPDTGTNLL